MSDNKRRKLIYVFPGRKIKSEVEKPVDGKKHDILFHFHAEPVVDYDLEKVKELEELLQPKKSTSKFILKEYSDIYIKKLTQDIKNDNNNAKVPEHDVAYNLIVQIMFRDLTIRKKDLENESLKEENERLKTNNKLIKSNNRSIQNENTRLREQLKSWMDSNATTPTEATTYLKNKKSLLF